MDNKREIIHTECDTINVISLTIHRAFKGN